MVNNAFRAFSVICISLLLTSMAWGWGPGHEDVARETFARLPESIPADIAPDALKQAIEKGCEYPDSFDPFQPERIGADGIRKLQQAGLKNRYGLHSDAGRGAMFVLLVDALREQQDHRAARGLRPSPTAPQTWAPSIMTR